MKFILRTLVYTFLVFIISLVDSWVKQNYPEALQVWTSFYLGVGIALIMQLFEE